MEHERKYVAEARERHSAAGDPEGGFVMRGMREEEKRGQPADDGRVGQALPEHSDGPGNGDVEEEVRATED